MVLIYNLNFLVGGISEEISEHHKNNGLCWLSEMSIVGESPGMI
jgi:hypothetical protein